jgi:hypothetical protein
MFEQQEPENQNLNEVVAQYGRKIIEPGIEIQFDVEKMEVEGRGAENLRFGLGILQFFANLPIITDEFKDNHEERRISRNKLYLENRSHWDIFENNKIRGNVVSSVEGGFAAIGEGVDDTDLLPSVKEEIKALIAACPKYNVKSYAAMTIEEKIRRVQQLDEMIIKTFELVSDRQGKILRKAA